MIADDAHIEPGTSIGDGTYVWHRAHVRTGAKVGSGCVIGTGAYIDTGVIVGNNCKIQNGAQLFAPAELGSGVFVGPGAILTNDRQPRAVSPDLEPKSALDWNAEGVRLDDGSSIGAGAIVIAGVSVGKWAMVAAGAVVARDVLSHELVAGVPAKNLGWVGRDGHRLRAVEDLWVGDGDVRYKMMPSGLEAV
jgi:acetyltransferase-like isoleucine patch superfamily enzyme